MSVKATVIWGVIVGLVLIVLLELRDDKIASELEREQGSKSSQVSSLRLP